MVGGLIVIIVIYLIVWIGAILMVGFGSAAIHNGFYKKLSKGGGIALVVIGILILLGAIPLAGFLSLFWLLL